MSCGRQANTPVFLEPPLFSSTGNRTPRNSSPAYPYTRLNPWLVVGGEPHECLWAKSSGLAMFCSASCSACCLPDPSSGVKRSQSLSQFCISRISMVPFARWSTYPDVLKSMWRLILMLFACHRRIFGLIHTTSFWCSLHLASIVLQLCSTHTYLQSDIHPVFGLCLIF